MTSQPAPDPTLDVAVPAPLTEPVVVQVRDGDLLVFQFDTGALSNAEIEASSEAAAGLLQQIHQRGMPAVSAILLTDRVTVAGLDEAAMKAQGWVRPARLFGAAG